jgi:hypothetical protein
MRKNLSNLRSSNPKEYWKILNTGCNSSKQKCNVNLRDLFDFYKEFNDTTMINDTGCGDNNQLFSEEELLLLSDVQLNNFINQPITGEEIRRCMKKMVSRMIYEDHTRYFIWYRNYDSNIEIKDSHISLQDILMNRKQTSWLQSPLVPPKIVKPAIY